MIHIGTVWRKSFSIRFFENVGVFGVLKRYGGRDIVLRDGINLDFGGRIKGSVNSGFDLSDINDSKDEELILWIGTELPQTSMTKFGSKRESSFFLPSCSAKRFLRARVDLN